MNEASNDNRRGYVQAVLVLVYEQREEYREVFASSVERLKELAERVFDVKPDVLTVVLWLEDTRQAWVLDRPKRNG